MADRDPATTSGGPAARSAMDAGRKLGVLVAISDFPLLVAGYRAVIDATPDLRVVGVVGSSESISEQVVESAADIVITECLPHTSGGCASFQVIEEIRAARPATKVLALECKCGSQQFPLAIKAGAHGFLTREAAADDVLTALRCVARGDTYVSPSTVTRMVNTYVLRSEPQASDDAFDALSERARADHAPGRRRSHEPGDRPGAPPLGADDPQPPGQRHGEAWLPRPGRPAEVRPPPRPGPGDGAVSSLGGALRAVRTTSLAAARRLRPTTRRGLVKGIAAVAVLLVGVAVAVVALGAAFSLFYGEYGFHPAENARSWAALDPSYADSSLCERCHQPEYAVWVVSRHQTVVCESCHGPLAAHAAGTSPDASAGSMALARVPEGICAACHSKVTGRPAAFPQVDLATHYPGAPCLWCHHPHDATALRPPSIPHSLAQMPACVTCHRPAGLKPVPAGHVESADAVCRQLPRRPDDQLAGASHERDRSGRHQRTERHTGDAVAAPPPAARRSRRCPPSAGPGSSRVPWRPPTKPVRAAEPQPAGATYDPSAHSWAFVMDTTTCIGCGRCVEACKLENHVPEDPELNRTWVELHVLADAWTISVSSPEGRHESLPADETAPAVSATVRNAYFVPRTCMQCENPPCTWVCPVSATFRTPGRDHPRGREALHRLRLLRGRLPVRCPVHGPGR